jgi:FAD/FMN-containing dehydrogenase
MVLRAIQSEGTCTGVYNQLKSKEHGIGIGKREFLHMERGENSINLMRDIKRAFDPNGILNPGKIFTLA